MLTEQIAEEPAVINFLESLEGRVHSLSDLRNALRSEIQAASVKGGFLKTGNQSDSAYFQTLASIERLLNTREAIKIVFSDNQQLVFKPFEPKRNVETCLFNIITKLVKEGNLR